MYLILGGEKNHNSQKPHLTASNPLPKSHSPLQSLTRAPKRCIVGVKRFNVVPKRLSDEANRSTLEPKSINDAVKRLNDRVKRCNDAPTNASVGPKKDNQLIFDVGGN